MLNKEQIQALSAQSLSKLEAMRSLIGSYRSALVAYSGGVDSSFVLKIASDVLGKNAVGLTALSPALPAEEEQDATRLASLIGARHVTVHSDELANPSYAKNPNNRCYFCKTELYDLCEEKRAQLGLSVICDGFNADDLKDYRPGHEAAKEHQVKSPLAQVGFTKNEIRAWSFNLGLPTWDKPQMACLASRIPYGVGVTRDRLEQIGGAESDLRRLGFRIFRVRYHGDVARLEVGEEEYQRFESSELRRQVAQALKARGFTFVALDLEPFRSGRMNEAAGDAPQAYSQPRD
jgi:uncharacterized protein